MFISMQIVNQVERRTRAINNITDNKVGAAKNRDILTMMPNEMYGRDFWAF
jgi:hypothetical protein